MYSFPFGFCSFLIILEVRYLILSPSIHFLLMLLLGHVVLGVQIALELDLPPL